MKAVPGSSMLSAEMGSSLALNITTALLVITVFLSTSDSSACVQPSRINKVVKQQDEHVVTAIGAQTFFTDVIHFNV